MWRVFLLVFRAVTDRVMGPSHSGRVPKSICSCAKTSSGDGLCGLLMRTIISPEVSRTGMIMVVRIARLDMV